MISKGSVILDEYSGPCCALNTFDGKKIADWGAGKVTVSYKYNDNGATAYVVEAYVTVVNATTGNITLTVPVDTLVKKGN